MAQDNMKEIMDNYQDMSLEQLGSSLLGRQSKINAERARQQRKDERIQKIIGGLLATQAIFGQNAKTKIDQINSGTKMAELSAQSMANKMTNFGGLVSGLEDKIGQNINYSDLSAEEQDLWIANFSKSLDPEFDSLAQKRGLADMYAWNNGKNTFYEELAPTLWNNIFLGKDGKPAIAQQFYESGSRVFEGAEGESLINLMTNADAGIIKQRQQLAAQNEIAKVRGENKITNIWTGIKDAGSYIFGKAEADNIFSSKENYTPFGEDASILQEINFENIIGTEFKKQLSKFYDNTDWSDAASVQEGKSKIMSTTITRQIDRLRTDLSKKNRQYPNVKLSQMKGELDALYDYFTNKNTKPDAQEFISYYGGLVLKADQNNRFKRELGKSIGADLDKFEKDAEYRRLAIFAAVLNDSKPKKMGAIQAGFTPLYETGDFQFEIDKRLLQRSVVPAKDGKGLDVSSLAEIEDENQRASAGVGFVTSATDSFQKKAGALESMWKQTNIFDAFKNIEDYTFIDFTEDFKAGTLPDLNKAKDVDIVAGAFESLEKATIEKQMKDMRSMNKSDWQEFTKKFDAERSEEAIEKYGKKMSNSMAINQVVRFQEALDKNEFGGIGSKINRYSGKNWRDMTVEQRRAVVEQMIQKVTEENKPIR